MPHGVRRGRARPKAVANLPSTRAIDKHVQTSAPLALCVWNHTRREVSPNTSLVVRRFPMVWDFRRRRIYWQRFHRMGWSIVVEWVGESRSSHNARFWTHWRVGRDQLASATAHPLPDDDTVDAVVTDPPYYAAIPYAVSLRLLLRHGCNAVWEARIHPELFTGDAATPKEDEMCAARSTARAFDVPQ